MASLAEILSAGYAVIDEMLTRLNDAKYAHCLVLDFGPQIVDVRGAMQQANEILQSGGVDAQDVERILGALDHLTRTLREAADAVACLPTESSPFMWYLCDSDIKDGLLRQAVRLDQQLNTLATLTNQAGTKAGLAFLEIALVEVEARREQRMALAEQEDNDDGSEPTGAERALRRFKEEHGDLLTEAKLTLVTRRREVRVAVDRLALLALAFDALEAKAAQLETEKQETQGNLEHWRRGLSGARAGLEELQENPKMWELLKGTHDAALCQEGIEQAEVQVTRYAEKLAEIEADIRNPRVLLPAWSDDGSQQEIPVTLDAALAAAREMGVSMGPESWAGGVGRNFMQGRIAQLQDQQREEEGLVLSHMQQLMIDNGNGGLEYEDVVRAVQEGTDPVTRARAARARVDVRRTIAATRDLVKALQPTAAGASDPPSPPPGGPSVRQTAGASA